MQDMYEVDYIGKIKKELTRCIKKAGVKIAVLAHTARSTRAILPKQESHLAGWLNSGWLN